MSQNISDIQSLDLQKEDAEYVESLVKRAFDLENDKKDKMLSNLNAIVAAFGGILAAVAITFTKLPHVDGLWSHIIALVFIANLFIVAKAFLVSFQLFSAESYKNFNNPQYLFDDIKALQDYLAHIPNGNQDGNLKKELRNNMIGSLADATMVNREINERRTRLRVKLYRYFCKAAGMISVLFVMEYLYEKTNFLDLVHVKQLISVSRAIFGS